LQEVPGSGSRHEDSGGGETGDGGSCVGGFVNSNGGVREGDSEGVRGCEGGGSPSVRCEQEVRGAV